MYCIIVEPGAIRRHNYMMSLFCYIIITIFSFYLGNGIFWSWILHPVSGILFILVFGSCLFCFVFSFSSSFSFLGWTGRPFALWFLLWFFKAGLKFVICHEEISSMGFSIFIHFIVFLRHPFVVCFCFI